MGAVYAARDSLGRMVALKQVHPQHLDANGLARFRREGQALAALKSHPNVVGVHALGMAHKGPYLVMDLVPGETLKDLLHRNPPSVERAVEIVAGLAEGVSHLHHAGVIHRDLKPANVLIREGDGTPVITDFGLARKSGDERLTQTGEVLGTPLYMSPEQLRGLQLDERADVWALGAILYELLTGLPPYGVGRPRTIFKALRERDPRPVGQMREEIPEGLERIVMRALARNQEDRFANAEEMANAIADFLADWDEPDPLEVSRGLEISDDLDSEEELTASSHAVGWNDDTHPEITIPADLREAKARHEKSHELALIPVEPEDERPARPVSRRRKSRTTRRRASKRMPQASTRRPGASSTARRRATTTRRASGRTRRVTGTRRQRSVSDSGSETLGRVLAFCGPAAAAICGLLLLI